MLKTQRKLKIFDVSGFQFLVDIVIDTIVRFAMVHIGENRGRLRN